LREDDGFQDISGSARVFKEASQCGLLSGTDACRDLGVPDRHELKLVRAHGLALGPPGAGDDLDPEIVEVSSFGFWHQDVPQPLPAKHLD
jgi:hypothetical protein